MMDSAISVAYKQSYPFIR